MSNCGLLQPVWKQQQTADFQIFFFFSLQDNFAEVAVTICLDKHAKKVFLEQ